MMGFGAMGMTPWIFGAIAVAAIWGGLWWLLSTIGSHTGADTPTKELGSAPPPEQASDWQQPPFEQPAVAHTPTPLSTQAKPESDYR